MPDNPFSYGNPVREPSRFFGREREVDQILGRLRNRAFESSSLVGDRRIGKTSLLYHLADPGVRASHGLGSGRYSFIYADLQQLGDVMGPDHLWHRLLALTRKHCPDRELAAAITGLAQRERLTTYDLDELFGEFDDKEQHTVFLLDEFERVTENENFGPEFYFGLRSLMIHHRVALVTSSRLELIELCHSDAIKASPFFNVFANIHLRLFSGADFQLMLSQSLRETEVEFSGPELEQVRDLAGLHPYFLQIACYMLYDSYQLGLDEAARRDYLAERFRGEANPHITDYWNYSNDYEKITLTAAALLERTAKVQRGFTLKDLQGVFVRGEPYAERLEKRGLLMSRDGHYHLFSAIFGPWILDQLAAGLAEEQSYHEWLGANRDPVERITGKQGSLLREILPKIGTRYRHLIMTWASDPQTVTAMAGLLRSVLTLVN